MPRRKACPGVSGWNAGLYAKADSESIWSVPVNLMFSRATVIFFLKINGVMAKSTEGEEHW